jgi:RNA polymerase sigma-70 factor (ECF subfamily)
MHTLVAAMLPRVRNLVRYLVRGDDIDDLSQDALVKVLERLPSYRGEGRFEAWVDGITLRVTLRALGKRRAEARRTDGSVTEEQLASPSGNSSPRYVSRRRAVAALDELPDAQRHALVMHHVLGMTVGEISDELSVPQETVRSRLRLGMGQLRAVVGVLREWEDT